MFVGPIFGREALTSPRQFRHFLIRAGYVGVLLVLLYTARVITFGFQDVRNFGDVSRFGSLIFQIYSLVQLSLVLSFAVLFASGNIAQEKDRKTLDLLLMTDLRDWELVLGKLCASLLLPAVLLGTSIPFFAFIYLLGGISLSQIGWSLALCGATAIAAGSWGAFVALWREKTFQTLAISVLGLVLLLGVVEAVTVLMGGSQIAQWVALLNPFRAMLNVLHPLGLAGGVQEAGALALRSVLALLALAVALNAIAVARLRVWNPVRVRELRVEPGADEAQTKAAVRDRNIWSQPVIWREIRTQAYGRKVFVIKLAYLALAAFAALIVTQSTDEEAAATVFSAAGSAFVGLSLISLLLINAQAVTSLTSERDGKTLELLLVTNITAKEFVFGKLGGALFNTKELILTPLAFLVYFAASGAMTWENFVYASLGFLVLVAFSAMLGLHAGLSFDRSRSAIANSMGTMFFLFIGIFICMMLIVEARSSFGRQLSNFLVFIVGGSLGLWASLTHKNPSSALTLAAAMLPFLTFYAIVGFLLNEPLGSLLAIAGAYGFTTIAMLIPAYSEFDVALGRTTLDKG